MFANVAIWPLTCVNTTSTDVRGHFGDT